MKIYLAGWQASNRKRELKLIKSGAIVSRCFSFANMVKIPGLPFFLPGTEEGYQVCKTKGVGIMMDSGVFSYRTHKAQLQRSGKPITTLPSNEEYIRLYVEFCLANKAQWDIYVTVDFSSDSAANFAIHQRLEKMGIRPLPVYHGDDKLEWLEKYLDRGYKYICIGGTTVKTTGSTMGRRSTVTQRRRFLDVMFNAGAKYGIQFHGLAVTSPWAIIEYPWKSTDSSSWSRAAGYGCILRLDQEKIRISTVRVSNRGASGGPKVMVGTSSFLSMLRKEIEKEGYDFDELQTDHIARHEYNARTMQQLAALSGTRLGGGFLRF